MKFVGLSGVIPGNKRSSAKSKFMCFCLGVWAQVLLDAMLRLLSNLPTISLALLSGKTVNWEEHRNSSWLSSKKYLTIFTD